MIKNFEPRLYQQTIFATAAEKNTLVVLPTGMGKTNISLMLAVHRLKQYPSSKILILAPTKPLVEQIMNVFIEHLDFPEEKITLFTGNIKPEMRHELWEKCQIIASTPQSIENDILSGKISLQNVSLLVIDEAQHAVGDYSYVWLAKQYEKTAKYPRIVALTASPGSDIEKINEILTNLFIEEIEVRTDADPDVRPYIHDIDINWIKVELPEELKSVQKYLKECYNSKLKEIENYWYINNMHLNFESKTDLLKLQAHLQGEIAHGNKDFNVLRSLSVAAEAIKVQHAVELIETQGLTALKLYMEGIQKQSRTTKTKAVLNLVRDLNFRSALIKTTNLIEKNIEHPKLNKLKELLQERIKTPNYKSIVFTQYRDSGQKIVEELNLLGIKAKLFVGQAKRRQNGLTQKKQIEMLDEFGHGDFNVLVSSSVGEEGLDIPQVDEVIFYEPIPSAIRHIQRRGRTGRQEKGKVTILVTEGTRDVGYRWSAFHKEKKMYKTLKDIKKNLIFKERKEPTLNKFIPEDEKIKIYADHREKASGVIKELVEQGVNLQLGQLSCSDYIISNNVCVEYKTQIDFIDSLIDGRLFVQVKEMKNNFLKPIIIVEGNNDLYSIRNLHPNSLRGMLASIAINFNVPVLYTKTFKDSAAMLISLAKREQEEYGKDFSIHGSKKPSSFKEQQEYIVSSLPGVGLGLAKPLLDKFKTVKNIINATEEELKEVEQIGEKKAKRVKEIVEKEY